MGAETFDENGQQIGAIHLVNGGHAAPAKASQEDSPEEEDKDGGRHGGGGRVRIEELPNYDSRTEAEAPGPGEAAMPASTPRIAAPHWRLASGPVRMPGDMAARAAESTEAAAGVRGAARRRLRCDLVLPQPELGIAFQATRSMTVLQMFSELMLQSGQPGKRRAVDANKIGQGPAIGSSGPTRARRRSSTADEIDMGALMLYPHQG